LISKILVGRKTNIVVENVNELSFGEGRPGTIVADGDFVIVHGRFSGFLPVNWIAADILRIKDGFLAELQVCPYHACNRKPP